MVDILFPCWRVAKADSTCLRCFKIMHKLTNVIASVMLPILKMCLLFIVCKAYDIKLANMFALCEPMRC